MHPWLVGALQAAALVAGALLCVGPRWRRWLGFVLVMASAVGPFLASPQLPPVIFLTGLVGVLAVLRGIDLLRERSALSAGARVWLVWAVFDSRRATVRPRGVEVRAVGGLVLALVIAALAFVAATRGADALTGVARWPVRWLAGMVFCVAAADAGTRLIPIGYGLGGIAPPLLHDAPYLAVTISEFWGVRWNKTVGTWLRLNLFLPFARRRRPFVGIVAAFVVSTLLHVYLLVAALDWRWGLVMGAFFIVQIAFVLVERALGVRSWPRFAARAWTLGVLGLASPLFVEPMLRVLEAPWS